MNTTIILFTLISTVASYKINPKPWISHVPVDETEEFAKQVLQSFEQSSVHQYTALFPSLKEVQQLMQENSSVYGNNLQSAKDEFAARYKVKILPEVRNTFLRVVKKGEEKGIDWGSIQFIRVELGESNSMTIVFSFQGKEYQLILRKAMILHDQWKVTQYIDLV